MAGAAGAARRRAPVTLRQLQAAAIESRLTVPGQGSPKSPFEAEIVQLALPRQADDTVLAELEA
jgi:hypothetical protein